MLETRENDGALTYKSFIYHCNTFCTGAEQTAEINHSNDDNNDNDGDDDDDKTTTIKISTVLKSSDDLTGGPEANLICNLLVFSQHFFLSVVRRRDD